MNIVRNILCAALTVLGALALTVPAAAAPAVPDAEAQLDVIAASDGLWKEIEEYHVTRNTPQSDRKYDFFVAVTDLDGNGRLELLVSQHDYNEYLLYHAWKNLSEVQRDVVRDLIRFFPSHVHNSAYEVSADRSHLEPVPIVDSATGEPFPYYGSYAFPDFTGISCTPRVTEEGLLYHVTTDRVTGGQLEIRDGAALCAIASETQTILLRDGRMTVTWVEHADGTASTFGNYVEPIFMRMKLVATGEEIDPRNVPPEYDWNDRGHPVNAFPRRELEQNPRAVLGNSYYGWTHDGEEVHLGRG